MEEKNPAEPTPTEAMTNDSNERFETADSHDEDVKAALDRDTQDGKGEEEVPPENWQSYATDGVEKEGNN